MPDLISKTNNQIMCTYYIILFMSLHFIIEKTIIDYY